MASKIDVRKEGKTPAKKTNLQNWNGDVELPEFNAPAEELVELVRRLVNKTARRVMASSYFLAPRFDSIQWVALFEVELPQQEHCLNLYSKPASFIGYYCPNFITVVSHRQSQCMPTSLKINKLARRIMYK